MSEAPVSPYPIPASQLRVGKSTAWEPDSAWMLDLPLTNSVIFVKSLNLSEPQFPSLSTHDKV